MTPTNIRSITSNFSSINDDSRISSDTPTLTVKQGVQEFAKAVDKVSHKMVEILADTAGKRHRIYNPHRRAIGDNLNLGRRSALIGGATGAAIGTTIGPGLGNVVMGAAGMLAGFASAATASPQQRKEIVNAIDADKAKKRKNNSKKWHESVDTKKAIRLNVLNTLCNFERGMTDEKKIAVRECLVDTVKHVLEREHNQFHDKRNGFLSLSKKNEALYLCTDEYLLNKFTNEKKFDESNKCSTVDKAMNEITAKRVANSTDFEMANKVLSEAESKLTEAIDDHLEALLTELGEIEAAIKTEAPPFYEIKGEIMPGTRIAAAANNSSNSSNDRGRFVQKILSGS